MKTYNDYKKEQHTLLNMFTCSIRYINGCEKDGEQRKGDDDMLREFHELYAEYAYRLEKSCLQDTGRSLLEKGTA